MSKNNQGLITKAQKSPGIATLTHDDTGYPEKLRGIYEPPSMLYVRGNIECLESSTLAVVGSRRMSAYGQSAMRVVLADVIRAGITTVSGLAYGVDSLAHTLSVEQNRPTIAVLGTGVDAASIYPVAHRALSERIISSGGCLVSEYPPGTPPMKHHFIARNRIIAGLSEATLIVEAARKSGSLITADFALQYNREVMAIPGPIGNENSAGVHQLIKDGARMVTETHDILELYGIEIQTVLTQGITGEEKILLQLLKQSPRSFEALAQATSLSHQQLLGTLSMLEINRHILKTSSGEYILI